MISNASLTSNDVTILSLRLNKRLAITICTSNGHLLHMLKNLMFDKTVLLNPSLFPISATVK